MELCTADAYLLGEHIDVEVAVGEVLVDSLHDALHEQLVVTLDLGLFHLVGLLLGTAVLTLQAQARAEQVIDVHAEFLHVERFGEEGVGTALETFETVGDIGLRRQHDDGNMRDVDVGLDHAEHGEAVHLGHHDIADDEVVLVGKQFAQAFLAVSAGAELVETAQLGGDVAAYLKVVVDDEHTVFATLFRFVGGGALGGFWYFRYCVNLLRSQVSVA